MNRDLLCYGDLMTELVIQTPCFPELDRTLLLHGRPLDFGGTAFNVAWHLARWKRSPVVSSHYGESQRHLVEQEFAEAGLSAECLHEVRGETDHLLVLQNADRFLAIYIVNDECAGIPAGNDSRPTPEGVLIAGSRHAASREACCEIAESTTGPRIFFSPSYAVYEYEAASLARMLELSYAVQVNRKEAKFIAERLGLPSVEELARAVPGAILVTKDDEGATLYQQDIVRDFRCESHFRGDVIGAGDAFFAAFIHSVLEEHPVAVAAEFATKIAGRFVDLQPPGRRMVRLSVSLEDVNV